MHRTFKRFLGDSSGQFAVMTAILAVPLVICVGVAVDAAYLNSKSTTLQTSLDSAALAAVIPGNLDNAQRAEYAKEVFHHNYTEPFPVDLKVVATPQRVDIQGIVEKETLFMGLNGVDKIRNRLKSGAIKTNEDVVCIMTLNESAEGSLVVDKNAMVKAPGCSIQVNSRSEGALVAQGIYEPYAKRICVHGGIKGDVGPNAQANCTALDDPYADVKAPQFAGDDSACNYGPLSDIAQNAIGAIANSIFGGLRNGRGGATSTDDIFDQFSNSFAVGEAGKLRYPGVYCEGMHIYDSDITLMPGTYYIHNGPLSIGKNSSVKGEGVTFVFSGRESFLYTYDEVSLDLTAPKTGNYAGIIFFQDANSSKDKTSIIKGNAKIRLVGTTYFPTQDLFIGGLGEMGAESRAMAFIANNITFTSEIDKVITRSEADFQRFKNLMEQGAHLLYRLGLSDYQVQWDSDSGSGTLEKDFHTVIRTDLGSQAETGIPMPLSDGGARLVSVDNSPL